MKKRILVAPLNWGLGHATRCIPIIKALINMNFTPILASDGNALLLLKEEFPQLEVVTLPDYNIEYAKKGKNLKFKLLKNSPKMISAIRQEQKQVKDLVRYGAIDGIISDNRFGVYSKMVPSVFITHQLKVLSGKTTWLTTKMHAKIISKYQECWVPDTAGRLKLSGALSHLDSTVISTKYIGPISRFKKERRDLVYDIMVLLSGPEPQRSLLETILLRELKCFKGKVLFVKGRTDLGKKVVRQEPFTIYNYMTSIELQKALNESRLIISRSGYTTIMDLAKVEKKAFFIPTPGQFEQEYLAKRLTKMGLVPSCEQENFSINKLDVVSRYKGFSGESYDNDFKKLFGLFEGE